MKAVIVAVLLVVVLTACASKGYRATEYRQDGTVASTVEFETRTFVYGPTLQDVVATDGNRTVSIGSEQTDTARALGLSETLLKAVLPLLAPVPVGAAAARVVVP